MHENHEEYMKRRLREEEEEREEKLVAEYEERAWKTLENKLQWESNAISPKKIYESPDGGKTVYERDFGSTNRFKTEGHVNNPVSVEYTPDGSIEIKLRTDDDVELSKSMLYKYNEGNLIEEFKAYVDATYDQHYSRDKFQATEFIMDGGHGTGFCIGNVLKYAQRYGKKGTRDDARKDIMKVLHYALLQLYVHDIENEQ
jgi:hypothetical protein